MMMMMMMVMMGGDNDDYSNEYIKCFVSIFSLFCRLNMDGT